MSFKLIKNMTTSRFPANVTKVLRAYSGDKKKQWKLAKGWELFPAARKVLDEFGGLRVGLHPDSDMPYCATTIVIDPNNAVKFYLDDESPFTLADGTKVYPLGLVEEDGVFLFIDEAGIVYAEGVASTCIVAPTFDQALIRLINGDYYWEDEDAEVHIPRRPFEP